LVSLQRGGHDGHGGNLADLWDRHNGRRRVCVDIGLLPFYFVGSVRGLTPSAFEEKFAGKAMEAIARAMNSRQFFLTDPVFVRTGVIQSREFAGADERKTGNEQDAGTRDLNDADANDRGGTQSSGAVRFCEHAGLPGLDCAVSDLCRSHGANGAVQLRYAWHAHHAVARNAWNELAGAAQTVLTPTGLAAITIALFSAVKAGDHILVADTVYRPTRHFCDTVLQRLGVETTYYDPMMGGPSRKWSAGTPVSCFWRRRGRKLRSPGPARVTAVAQQNKLCAILDNTWATPLFYPPHVAGIDIAVEAGTKYLSGHSDLLLGLTSANAAWAERLRATFDSFAMCAGPEDVFLGLRGLRTLDLRLREAERQGLAMAHWLAARPEVATVLHPALPSCPATNLEAGFQGIERALLHHPQAMPGGRCRRLSR